MKKEILEKQKNAKTNEERNQIIDDKKSVMNENDLTQVNGGRRPEFNRRKAILQD